MSFPLFLLHLGSKIGSDIPTLCPWWWEGGAQLKQPSTYAVAKKINRVKSVAHKNGWTTSGYVMISPSNQGTRLEWREKSQLPNGKTSQEYQKEKQTIRNCKKQTQGSKFACKMQPKRFPPYFTCCVAWSCTQYCICRHVVFARFVLHLNCPWKYLTPLIEMESGEGRTQKFWYILNRTWHISSFMVHVHICWKPDLISPCSHRLKWGPRATAQCFAQPFVAHFGFHTMHLGMRLSKDIAGTLIPSGTSRTQRFAKLTLSKCGTIWFPGMLCHPKSNDSLEGSPVWRPHSAKVPGGWWRPVDRLEMLATGNDGPLEKVPSFKCYVCCLCWWCTLNFRGVNPKWSIWCHKETEN